LILFLSETFCFFSGGIYFFSFPPLKKGGKEINTLSPIRDFFFIPFPRKEIVNYLSRLIKKDIHPNFFSYFFSSPKRNHPGVFLSLVFRQKVNPKIGGPKGTMEQPFINHPEMALKEQSIWGI
jgi:hypothetical protein